jgi:hypothetical protein
MLVALVLRWIVDQSNEGYLLLIFFATEPDRLSRRIEPAFLSGDSDGRSA